MPSRRSAFALLLAGLFAAPFFAAESGRPEPYVPTGIVSGNLSSIGSDTLNNLMTLWAEGFRAIHPNVNIQIEGKGSSTAPAALLEGTAQFGPMSRAMKASEIDAFKRKYGFEPTAVKVALDVLAVVGHRDNPLAGVTLAQLDGLFSKSRKLGGPDLSRWGELGLTEAWANRPVALYGRNSASGTYGFFREEALGGGDFKATVKEQPGSSAVIQGVAADLGGLGYGGVGYLTSGVKALALGRRADQLFAPNVENAVSGHYPLARWLYLYLSVRPGQPLEPLQAEFLRYVTSAEGQEIVRKDGYYPLPEPILTEAKALTAGLPPAPTLSPTAGSTPRPAAAPVPAAREKSAEPKRPAREYVRRALPEITDPMKLDLTDFDVRDVLTFLARLTGKHLIVDSTIQGLISVRTERSVSKAQAIGLIESTLLLNGFTLVDRGEALAVLGLAKNARGAGVPLVTKIEDLPATDRVVTFVFKPKHQDVAVLERILRQYATANLYTSFVADPLSRSLLVTETTPVLRQLVRVLAEIDTEEAARNAAKRPSKEPVAARTGR